jgi:hypothetical protein
MKRFLASISHLKREGRRLLHGGAVEKVSAWRSILFLLPNPVTPNRTQRTVDCRAKAVRQALQQALAPKSWLSASGSNAGFVPIGKDRAAPAIIWADQRRRAFAGDSGKIEPKSLATTCGTAPAAS